MDSGKQTLDYDMKGAVRLWHVLLYVAILVLVVSTGLVEYRSRYKDILTLLRTQVVATATAIAHGGSRQVALSADLEKAYVQRALDLIHTVDQLELDGLLTPTRLDELAKSNNFFRLYLFNDQGELLMDAGSFPGFGHGAMQGGGRGMIRFLEPLFSGQQDTLVIGVGVGGPGQQLGPRWNRLGRRPPDFGSLGDGMRRSGMIIGIRRLEGGVIAGRLTLEAESFLQSATDLRPLLTDMLDIKGLAYMSIIAAGRESLTVAQFDISLDNLNSWPRNSLDDQTSWVTNEDKDFIELRQPLELVGMEATLLVGFTAEPLIKAQQNVVWHILFRSGVFTTLTVLLIAVILSRQNSALLAAEKNRIEKEVDRLQQLRHLQDKQAAMGQLAAGVAHEIRNPLNAIGILAQRIRREIKPETGQEEFQQLTGTMSSEITRINSLLEEFLTFARPTPLEFGPVIINELVEHVVQLYTTQAEEKGVTLLGQAVVSLQIEGDAYHLRQALSNLVKNALEATSEGDEIRIQAERFSGQIILRIVDTGHGIPPDNLSRIFDLFYTTRDKGTGVGLALTHKIIADHGGTIEVDSTPDQGTTFTLIIPESQM